MDISLLTPAVRENTSIILRALNFNDEADAFGQIDSTEKLHEFARSVSSLLHEELENYRKARDTYFKRFWEIEASLHKNKGGIPTQTQTDELVALKQRNDTTKKEFLRFMAFEESVRGFLYSLHDVKKLQTNVRIYRGI